MEGTNTTNTQNENSNNYLLSPEEEKIVPCETKREEKKENKNVEDSEKYTNFVT